MMQIWGDNIPAPVAACILSGIDLLNLTNCHIPEPVKKVTVILAFIGIPEGSFLEFLSF
jgi:hypothetical protein